MSAHALIHAEGWTCSCEPQIGAATAIDPVCGMKVSTEGAKQTATLNGQHYYFCCGWCRTKFLANPAAYLQKLGLDAETQMHGMMRTNITMLPRRRRGAWPKTKSAA